MDPRGEDGFTLMETLIALIIMVTVATMLYRGLSGGLRVNEIAGNTERALVVAQARLAGLGHEIPVAAGRVEGQDGDMGWELTIRPYQPPDAADRAAQMSAFWATVTVFWRDRRGAPLRSLQLTTLKLEPSP
jgi:prepilin-type N-terminal cleavage/methylation domain-containing protein